MEIVKPEPIYISDEAPRLEETIYRLDSGSRRFYYILDKEIEFFESITTLAGETLKTSPFLDKWRADLGWEESKAFMNERACYGTSLHILAGEYLMGNKLNLEDDYIEATLQAQAALDGVSYSHLWVDDLKRDMLAFARWVYDYDVTPLLIEQVLVHDGLGGAIDLYCALTIKEKGFWGEVYKSGVNKGKPKESYKERRVSAIVDFKSGRKGFYESHEIQLKMYQDLFEAVFPDDPVDKLYNWSPKDWRTEPSYNFKDQTHCDSHAKIPYLKGLAFCNGRPRPKDVTVYEGSLEIGQDMTKNFKTIPIEDWIRGQHKENENN